MVISLCVGARIYARIRTHKYSNFRRVNKSLRTARTHFLHNISIFAIRYIFISLPAVNTFRNHTMNRTIITVVGKDTVGIIAKVCTYMADHQINILDISQTIIQGFFNMMMIVDTSKMTVDYATMTEEITRLGESTGVQIKCQKEEIFDKMHRI